MSRILVIEDDVVSNALLKTLLEDEGYEPKFAGSFSEATRMIRSDSNFVLVIADFKAKDSTLDGTTLRIFEIQSGLSVVVYSFDESGMDEIDTCPNNKPEELIKAIKRMLKEHDDDSK